MIHDLGQTAGKPTPDSLLKLVKAEQGSGTSSSASASPQRSAHDHVFSSAAFKEERDLQGLFVKPNASDWMIQPRI